MMRWFVRTKRRNENSVAKDISAVNDKFDIGRGQQLPILSNEIEKVHK